MKAKYANWMVSRNGCDVAAVLAPAALAGRDP